MREPVAIVAEDEPQLAQELLRLLATAWPELQIAAIATSGAGALRLADVHQPAVAFLDIQMPDGTGMEIAGELACENVPWLSVVSVVPEKRTAAPATGLPLALLSTEPWMASLLTTTGASGEMARMLSDWVQCSATLRISDFLTTAVRCWAEASRPV